MNVTGKAKAQAKREWERRGCYAEAMAYLDERLAEWKGAGVPRADKVNHAWMDTLERFPVGAAQAYYEVVLGEVPQENASVNISGSVADQLDVESLGVPADFERDLQWVMDNIRNPAPVDPPSDWAVWVLELSREEKLKFFELTARLHTQKKQKTDEQKAFEDDKRRQFSLLETLAAELGPLVCPKCGAEVE